MMNRSVLLPILLAALTQAGCVSETSQPAFVGLSPGGGSVDAAAPPASRPAAAALPTAAGHVVAVRTTQAGDGVSHDIVLNGGSSVPGENAIHITLSRPPATGRLGGPTEDTVVSELAAEFPGVRMRLAAASEASAAGPLGIALGQTGSVTCLYAWRSMSPDRALLAALGAPNDLSRAEIRVRLCQTTTAEKLIGIVRGLTLAPLAAAGDVVAGTGLEAFAPDERRLASMAAADSDRAAMPAGHSADPARTRSQRGAHHRSHPPRGHQGRENARDVAAASAAPEPSQATWAKTIVPLPMASTQELSRSHRPDTPQSSLADLPMP